MSLNHGINTNKADTNFASVTQGTVGIPFVVGTAPVHKGEGFKGMPQIFYSFGEAKKALGYSEDWSKWTLCEFIFSQFQLYGAGPVVVYNVYDPATAKVSVSASSKTVTDHIVEIDDDAIVDSNLVVKNGEETIVKDTDYAVYYSNDKLIIELLKNGSAYGATALSVAYNKAKVDDMTASVTAGIEKIEECKARFGLVPDLIVAPGFSNNEAVAAVMAAKAASINGLFKGKAVVDLDCSSSGADTYDKVAAEKSARGYTDANMIVCWPMAKNGDKTYHMSTVVCGVLANTDAANNGVPFESPSNKGIAISGCVDAAGKEVLLSVQQADVVSFNAGVVTAINYNNWVLWGNYTGASASTDVAKKFICTNRMMDFICNSFVDTYWAYLDRPLTRVLIDAVVNGFNSFLAGLTGDGALYGGEIAYVEGNNPAEDLIAGKFRLDVKIASPVPAQRIDMLVEFDVNTLENAING